MQTKVDVESRVEYEEELHEYVILPCVSLIDTDVNIAIALLHLRLPRQLRILEILQELPEVEQLYNQIHAVVYVLPLAAFSPQMPNELARGAVTAWYHRRAHAKGNVRPPRRLTRGPVGTTRGRILPWAPRSCPCPPLPPPLSLLLHCHCHFPQTIHCTALCPIYGTYLS